MIFATKKSLNRPVLMFCVISTSGIWRRSRRCWCAADSQSDVDTEPLLMQLKFTCDGCTSSVTQPCSSVYGSATRSKVLTSCVLILETAAESRLIVWAELRATSE